MSQLLRGMGTPLVIHQPKYNMLDRHIENGLQTVLEHEGIGSIAFCPLAQGLLTDKYLNGIPKGSRAESSAFLTPDAVKNTDLSKIAALNAIAKKRGQTLAQMALSWALRGGRLTSVLIGASRPSQIAENVNALSAPELTAEELAEIDAVLCK